MDIDEFLDRELAGLDTPADKSTGREPGPDSSGKKDDFDPSSLFEGAQSSLAKGRMEEAEQTYLELWRMLLQQKLKWSKELYEKLLIISRQFLSELNKAYADVEKKSDYAYDLIKKARASIQEGKKDLSYKIYSQAVEINSSIPNVFFEEKRVLHGQITQLYSELKSATDNELVKRIQALVQELNQLIDKINLSMRSNDFSGAIASYNRLIEVYNQVPEGFLREKATLGPKILEIYKNLSIYTEITNLQRQISQQPNFEQTPVQPSSMGKISASSYASRASALIISKIESAKKNLDKGLYNEAYKDIEDVLKIEPKHAEAKVIHAKIKTLQ